MVFVLRLLLALPSNMDRRRQDEDKVGRKFGRSCQDQPLKVNLLIPSVMEDLTDYLKHMQPQ